MNRNKQGQFIKATRPKGFMTSKEALAQELAKAGLALQKSVNQKTVVRTQAAVMNAKRILLNTEQIHNVEGTEVTKELSNKAWLSWREAARQFELALQGDLNEKHRFLLKGF